jgi:hypothetical protein
MIVNFTAMGAVDDFKYVMDNTVPYFSFDGDRLEIDIPDALVLNEREGYLAISPYELEEFPDLGELNDYYGTKVYIGPESFYVSSPEYGMQNEYRVHYSELGIDSFDKSDLLAIVEPVASIIVAVTFVGGLIGAFAGGAVFMLIVTLIAMLINSAMGIGLRFGQLYGLSVYAMTAHVTLKTVLGAAGWLNIISIDLHWLFSYGITLVFVVLYLLAVKRSIAESKSAEITTYTENTPGGNDNNTLPPFDPNK